MKGSIHFFFLAIVYTEDDLVTSCVFMASYDLVSSRTEGVYRGVSREDESLPLSDVRPTEIRPPPTGRRTATSATGQIGGGQPRATCQPHIQTQMKNNLCMFIKMTFYGKIVKGHRSSEANNICLLIEDRNLLLNRHKNVSLMKKSSLNVYIDLYTVYCHFIMNF